MMGEIQEVTSRLEAKQEVVNMTTLHTLETSGNKRWGSVLALRELREQLDEVKRRRETAEREYEAKQREAMKRAKERDEQRRVRRRVLP